MLAAAAASSQAKGQFHVLFLPLHQQRQGQKQHSFYELGLKSSKINKINKQNSAWLLAQLACFAC